MDGLRFAFTTILMVTSISANSAIISVDWKSNGDDLITRDTTNNMEWLDLSLTLNLSWNEVWTELGAGGQFEGWRMASKGELTQFFNEFGGDGYYNGFPSAMTNIFDSLSQYWGDTKCLATGCTTGDGYSKFFTASQYGYGNVWQGIVSDTKIDISLEYASADSRDFLKGTALFRYYDPKPVPAPASVGLLGIGLLLCKRFIFSRKFN